MLHVEAQAGVIREDANAPDAVGGGARNLRHGAQEVPGEDHVTLGDHRRLADVAGEHRARGRGLGVPGEGRERRGENLTLGPPVGAPVLDRLEDLLRRRGEVGEQLVVDEVNLERRLLRGGGHHLARGGRVDDPELDARLADDAADPVLFPGGVHGDRGALLVGAAGATAPVHKGLGVMGELVVNHEVDVGDVEAARGDVGGDEDAEAAVAEALEGAFALRLSDVAVEHLGGHAPSESGGDLVSLSLRLREADGLGALAVHGDQVREDGGPARVGARAGHDIDGIGHLLLLGPHEVDRDVVGEVLLGNARDPRRHRR